MPSHACTCWPRLPLPVLPLSCFSTNLFFPLPLFFACPPLISPRFPSFSLRFPFLFCCFLISSSSYFRFLFVLVVFFLSFILHSLLFFFFFSFPCSTCLVLIFLSFSFLSSHSILLLPFLSFPSFFFFC